MKLILGGMKMNVKITTANCEVIDSGFVTSFTGEPINIILDATTDTPFTISFVFLKDNEIKGSFYNAEAPNQREVVFRLTNFTDPLGTGIIKPIEIANNAEGKKIYISFFAYTVGESAPTLHYTIYKEM